MAIAKPPRRNLPGAAEAWGRYVDDRLRQAQVDADSLRRDLTSGLRAVNSSMNRIATQQSVLLSQQAQLAAQLETINTLVASQVAVNGDSTTVNGYNLNNGTWRNISEITLTPPSWTNRVIINATGVVGLVANTDFAVPSIRINVYGITSQEFELPPGTGANAIPFMGTVGFTRDVSTSSPIWVRLQVLVNQASQWHTGTGNRKSQLSATGIFTR